MNLGGGHALTKVMADEFANSTDGGSAIDADLRDALAAAANPRSTARVGDDRAARDRCDARIAAESEAHFRAAFGPAVIGRITGTSAVSASPGPGGFARVRPWAGLGIAAALLLVLLPGAMVIAPAPPVDSTRATASPVRHDLDGDGRVTIVDAFVLARGTGPAIDVDGDGVSDARDVERLADLAVRGTAPGTMR